MKTFEEILAERKKKKGAITSVSSDSTRKSFDEILAERNIKRKKNDLGPVDIAGTENGTDERKWFQKSALFDDGYDFGDVWKTIIGSGTDVTENVGAGFLGSGEKIVDALSWLGTAMHGQQMQTAAQNEMIYNTLAGNDIDGKTVMKNYDDFQSQVEKGSEEFIKKDLYDEQAIAKKIITDPVEEKHGINVEDVSVFGEKSDELAQSAGQLGATALANAIAPGTGLVMTGVTTFGGEMESALNQGATYDEAAFSSAVSAGAEMLTEKLTGGIKFGGKALDDVLTSKITSSISNGVVRKLVDFGMDATGEGFEEVLSGAMSAVGQKLSYMSDKEFTELFSIQDAWDSFIGGATLGGLANASKNVKAKINGVDSVTGLTKNEQAVFDKVYNDRVAEATKGGKKLSGKEKSNIYNDVMNAIEKGYIGIDTIESVLGGETYKQYQSAVEKDNQMKELQKEYDSLYKMKNGEKSDEQIDRQAELKKQLEEYRSTSNMTQLKEQLSNEVSELAKTSKLSESYNEKSRRSQAFEADLSKYDAKAQETVKRAIDSGILNNTNRTHEFVDLVAKLSADKGVLFDFTNNQKIKESGFAIEGKTVNGYVQGGNIAVNIDSASALNKVVGHEITHILEGTELYTELANVVKQYATTKGEYDSKLQSIAKLYEGIEDANIENELTADLIGEYLFTDPDFVNSLSAEQPTLFQKIFNEIKYLCKVATADSKEAKQLEKVKKTFAEAYKQKNNTATDDGVKYSVEYSNYEVNNGLLEFVDKVREGKTKSNDKFYFNTVTKENATEIYDLTGIDVSGFKIAIEARQVEHILNDHGEKSQSDKSMANDLDIARMEYTISNPDEITNSGRTQAYTHMKNGRNRTAPTVLLEKSIGEKSYYVVEAIADTNAKTVYVVTAFIGEKGYKKETSQLTDTKSPSATAEHGSASVSKNIISNPTENVKKNSLSDDNQDIAPVGDNNVYGEDIKLQPASAEDIAPIGENVAPGTDTVGNSLPDDYAPTAEDIKRQDTLVTDDAPIKEIQSAETTEDNNVEETIDTEAVTRLSSKVISTLGIGKSKANRNAVRELVKVLGDNYSDASKEDLYNAVAEKFGTQYVEELNEEIVGARSYLKEVKIKVSDSVKSEFGSDKDYRSFVKSNFGKLWISKEGAGIDQIYAELNRMYPHLFPGDISNQADQLKQISDVVNKPKSYFIPFELDEDTLKDATDLIYDSVTEYREAVSKVNQVADDIEAADISEKVKGQIKEELLTAYEKIEAEFNIDKKNLINKLNERKSFLETDTADKNNFLKYHAGELYGELKNLKKGIKASDDLAYFLDLDFNRNELKSTLLKVSKWPDTVLNSESEIETTVREFLDQKYNDSIQELNDFDWTMEDEISNLESKAEEKRDNARLAVNGKLVREIMDAEQVALMGDTSLWKDKSKGFMYKTETEHRNFRDIVRDKNGKKDLAKADALYDYFMGTYNHNEAELKREANKIKKEYADLKLNKYEDVFVQMKGEFLHNPDTELTQHDIDTFLKLHGDKVDETKVDKAIDMARETYDSLIERMNEVLVAHGMKPIEYRKGYFPHFSEVEKTKWQKITEKFLNWKTQNNDIPTDIAGMTESFKPNRSWQSFNKQRVNDDTEYSFMKGFDGYLQGSLDWIYHIDDIMKRRVFENRIRYDHSDNGIKEQIQEIYKNNEFDTNAKQEQIDLVFREAENPLNNFIIDFRTRTNTLAGKKSSMDRGMEEFTNRKFYSTMTNISNRVTANMVVGSFSSALTNFIPITQSWGEVSPFTSLRAMKDTIKSTFKDDGIINKSDFLTNRLRDVENLYQTGWDKVIDKAGFMMEAIDSFTAQTVWRSKYLENLSKGMSEAEAIKNADEFAERLIAGRSRGNMPTIFDSKNPIHKTFTAFQLEVNNQYRYMFKDMPQNLKDESAAKLVKGYAAMFIGANVYNALYSSLTGRDAAFDPMSIMWDLLSDLFDDEEDEPADVIMNVTDNIIDELPFVGGILGDGGRVPLSSVLPYGDGIRGAYEGTVTDLSELDIANLTKEWLLSAGAYLLLPAGGGQIKKTVQGLSMFDDDLPIAGSYTDSGKLRFSVEETMDEMIKAGIFGQYASKNARQYFDEERAPLSDKQTQELVDLDIPIAEYWEYQDGLKALGDDATLAEKVDYIADLEEFDTWQKNIMANNLTDRKESIDLTGYEDIGDFEEFDYATKNPGKYAVAKAVGGYDSYIKYSERLNNIESDKNANGESISGSRKIKVARYINNLDIEYGGKLILYRSQYKSDDTYNYQIIEYLNGRDDISREEMETILTELGFTVYDDGRVTW